MSSHSRYRLLPTSLRACRLAPGVWSLPEVCPPSRGGRPQGILTVSTPSILPATGRRRGPHTELSRTPLRFRCPVSWGSAVRTGTPQHRVTSQIPRELGPRRIFRMCQMSWMPRMDHVPGLPAMERNSNQTGNQIWIAWNRAVRCSVAINCHVVCAWLGETPTHRQVDCPSPKGCIVRPTATLSLTCVMPARQFGGSSSVKLGAHQCAVSPALSLAVVWATHYHYPHLSYYPKRSSLVHSCTGLTTEMFMGIHIPSGVHGASS